MTILILNNAAESSKHSRILVMATTTYEVVTDVTLDPAIYVSAVITLVQSDAANMSEGSLIGTCLSVSDCPEKDQVILEAVEAMRTVLLPIICTFGILGLLLTIVVLSHKSMTTSTNCYLMALSVADLLTLVVFAAALAETHFCADSPEHYLFVIFKHYTTIFLNTFLMASIWCTVMLAIERYIAICMPYLASRACTVTNARIIITTLFLVSFLVRIPMFFEFYVYNHVARDKQVWRWLEPTHLHYDSNFRQVYPWVVDGALVSIIPFLILFVLNTRLIWEVRNSTKYLQRTLGGTHNSSVQREEQQITIMLISVIMVYFCCQVPYIVFTTVNSLRRGAASCSLFLIMWVATTLLVLKSSVNFIFYCWVSEKFRMTVKELVRRNKNNCRYTNMQRMLTGVTSMRQSRSSRSHSDPTNLTSVNLA